jgi:hypothetical protein
MTTTTMRNVSRENIIRANWCYVKCYTFVQNPSEASILLQVNAKLLTMAYTDSIPSPLLFSPGLHCSSCCVLNKPGLLPPQNFWTWIFCLNSLSSVSCMAHFLTFFSSLFL